VENVRYLPVVTPEYVHEEYEELPRVEALARLYELRDGYGKLGAQARARTVSEQHMAEYGHFLRSGCCADQPPTDAAA
jgi:hypothetical protein